MTDAIHLGNFLFTGSFHAGKTTKMSQQLSSPLWAHPTYRLKLGHSPSALALIAVPRNCKTVSFISYMLQQLRRLRIPPKIQIRPAEYKFLQSSLSVRTFGYSEYQYLLKLKLL